VWHNGGTFGFRSFAGYSPEQGVGAVALTNTLRGVDRLGFKLLDAAAAAA
jgi:D-alanyl-D-alanine-carboxypeptidase/D-alanyl-D-alanine-endopeptidase